MHRPHRSWPALLLACALPLSLSAQNPQRPIEDEVIYFVLPDRFANGDPGNDTGGITGDADAHGFDPTRKGFYHGGDLKGLQDRLDYLQGLGVTAIWLTPIFTNKPVQGPPNARSAGYHGYWITDFTQVDPHLGGNAAMRALVDAAHARGMKVIMDIVANHTADVIQYRECGTSGDLASGDASSACPYRSRAEYRYTRRARDGAAINPGFVGDEPTAQTDENFARLTDPEWAYTPYIPDGEQNSKVPAWLNDMRLYHNRGNSHWEGESALYGDFAGLDDLFTEHPRVRAGMVDIYKQWITDFKVDGFRIDTAKHVDDGFWQVFLPQILAHAKRQGIPDFYVFGEVFEPQVAQLSRFTRDVGFPAVLDFAFQRVVREVVADGAPARRLQALFAQDDAYGAGVAGRLPVFLGNHDMGRFGRFLRDAKGKDADDAQLLRRDVLANALMFFARGVPVIYYGDEQGFTGDGNDQDAREDMFPSRVASYNDNRLIGSVASTMADNFDAQHPLYRAIAAMAKVYRAHPGLRRGAQSVRLAENRAGLFVLSRIDADSGRDYLVVFNNAERERSARAPVGRGDGRWQRLLGEGADELSASHGAVRLVQPPLSFAVYAPISVQE